MPKTVINNVAGTLGSHASNGTQPVIFQASQNPDHTNHKDTRT